MSEKYAHLCVTRAGLSRPANMWPVRWLTEDDLGLFDEWFQRMGDTEGWTLEEWRNLQNEGYSYCGVVLNGRLCSTAGLWKATPDVWHVIAVRTDEEYRHRGMAKSVVCFIAEYILQHLKVAAYTTGESNVPSARTAQSVGFKFCTNIVNNDKWCANDPRPAVKDANCPLIT